MGGFNLGGLCGFGNGCKGLFSGSSGCIWILLLLLLSAACDNCDTETLIFWLLLLCIICSCFGFFGKDDSCDDRCCR